MCANSRNAPVPGCAVLCAAQSRRGHDPLRAVVDGSSLIVVFFIRRTRYAIRRPLGEPPETTVAFIDAEILSGLRPQERALLRARVRDVLTDVL
jgi:hypothetical protein